MPSGRITYFDSQTRPINKKIIIMVSTWLVPNHRQDVTLGMEDDADERVLPVDKSLLDSANGWMEKANELYAQKRYAEVHDALQKAQDALVQCHSESGNECLVLRKRASIYAEENDTLNAMHCHEIIMKRVLMQHRSIDEFIVEESIESLRALAATLGSKLDISISTPPADFFRQIAEFYLELSELDRAADTLHTLLDFLLANGFFDNESLWKDLEQIGHVYEDEERCDEALQCFEKAVIAKSHFYGENHIEVAKSLFDVARVMDEQGNVEGAMDLYEVAHAKYTHFIITRTDRRKPAHGSTMDDVLFTKIIPTLLDQGKYETALAHLNQRLETPEDSVNLGIHNMTDKSRIYFDLGRTYVGLEDYVSATICFVEAAKEEGAITELEVMVFLQHVEFLQRQRSRNTSFTISDADLESDNKSEGGDNKYFSRNGRCSLHSRNKEDREGNGIVVETRDEDLHGILMPDVSTTSDERSVQFLSFEQSGISTEVNKVPYKNFVVEMNGAVDKQPASPCITATDSTPLSQSAPLTPDRGSLSPDLCISQYGSRTMVKSSELEIHTDSQSQQLRRRTPSIVDKFRRRRKGGFKTLDERVGGKEMPFPSEEDYHSTATFDGPIQYINVRTPSWDSAISQITWRQADIDNSREANQEWWWGVTSEGFARWFPTAYVSQAVEAAEGFLSAEAIHAKKKITPAALDMLSTEYDECSNDPSQPISPSRGAALDSNEKPYPGKDPISSMNPPTISVPSNRLATNAAEIVPELELCKKRLFQEQNTHGKDSPEVAITLFTLAVLHSRMQNIKPAVEAATEALRVQNLNGDVSNAIQSLHFLADLHLHRHQFKSAIAYYSDALKLESARFGYVSDETAKTLNCIGAARSLQNEFALAMESHQEALRILHLRHGEDPKKPLISDTLCQIGSVYYRERNSLSSIQKKKDKYSTFIEGGMLEVIGRAHEDRGSYKMAIAFFEEKLQFLESRGQDEDTLDETAATLNSLGMLSSRAGLFTEAIDYYERALNLQVELGCHEVDLATVRVLIGAVHCHLGHWETSLKLLQESLHTLQRELGDEHETVAATHYQIGVVYSSLMKEGLASESFHKALDCQVELLGVNHPAALRTRRELGKIEASYSSGIDSALQTFEDILQEQQRIHGDKHPNNADTLHCIGCAYSKKNDFPNALRVLEECYYMRLEFLGWDHPSQAATLHEITKIHKARGRLKKASHICDAVLRIQTECLHEKHVDLARTFITKGGCYVAKGDFKDAMKCFMRAKSIMNDALGERHALSAEVHAEIGLLYLRKCQFDEAREEMQQALDVYKEAGIDDRKLCVQDTMQKLCRVERDEMLCV